jgi:hypothetical protein
VSPSLNIERVKHSNPLKRSVTHQPISPRLQVPTSSEKVQKVQDIPHRRVRFNVRKMPFLPSFLSSEEKRKIVDESRLALERWERRKECEDLMTQKKEESHTPANLTTTGDTMEKLETLETLEHRENNDDEKKKLFERLCLSRKIPFFSAYYKWKTCPADNYYTLDDYMQYLNVSARSTPLFLSIPFATTSVVTTHTSIE